MALTQVAFAPLTSVKGYAMWSGSVTATTAENDAYTLKTPENLDTSKQWDVLLYCSATPDGQALPVDLWGGYAESFAITGDSTTVAATNGVKIKQILDDCVLAVTPLIYQFTFDPDLPVADVVTVAAIGTGLKVRIPKFPYYAFNLNGGSTLNAMTATFIIVQKQR